MRSPTLLAALLLLSVPARAQERPQARLPADYDPASAAWNGLSTFMDLARVEGVPVEPTDVVRFGSLRPPDSLLVLYPTGPMPEGDILRFLAGGGRVAVADDYGSAGVFFSRLGFERSTEGPTGGDRLHGNPALPVARPRAPHPLTEGVDALVSNHASFLTGHGERAIEPAFDFGRPEEAAVVAGLVGGEDSLSGRIALIGDPSILINNMLDNSGNRRFAQNLVRYLGGGGGKILLVSGEFASVGRYGDLPGRTPAALIPAFNEFLQQLAKAGPPPSLVRVLALLVVLGTFLLVALVVPLAGHRYDGRWLKPGYASAAAGFLGKIQIFRGRRASYLYPALVLRRDLEARLVEALRLDPPVTVDAILDQLASRGVSAAERSDLRRLLGSLDRLQVRADRASTPPRVSARRIERLADAAERVLRLAAGMRRR